MFADPLANLTYNSVAQTAPRISQSGRKAIYQTADGSIVVTISHTVAKLRTRSMYRIDRNVDVNADSVLENHNMYVVYDRPVSGFSETDCVNLATCLFGSLTASTNAGIKKLNGGES